MLKLFLLLISSFGILAFINQVNALAVSNISSEELNSNGFLKKNGSNFYDISLVGNKEFKDPSKGIILIYLPGSASDDQSDDHCSVRSEFFSLIELLKFKPRNKNINLYLLCSHFIEGDQKYSDGIDQPYIYPGISKHEKYRINIEEKVIEFIDKGFPPNNIFLIGHSCGAWHALFLYEELSNVFNSTIAISPACFGPRTLWKKRPEFIKRRLSEIKFMKNINNFNPLIFLAEQDLRENTASLDELLRIKSVNFIQLPNKNTKGIYYVDDIVCTFHKNSNGERNFFILDPHNINFSRCFVKYINDIVNFINTRLS